MNCKESDWQKEGGIGEFDEFQAIQFAKGTLIEKLTNDPNRASAFAYRIK